MSQISAFARQWDKQWAETPREARHAAVAWELAERHAISEVVAGLTRVGIFPLLLKGAALAYTVYPRSLARPHADIDLMVPGGSMATVERTLVAMGFSRDCEISHPLLTTQAHFSRAGGGHVRLDVHEALVNPYVLRSLPSYEELSTRAVPVPVLGPLARALSPPDALLHALVHRVAHHNSSVDALWIHDIKLLVDATASTEWPVFTRTVHAARVCAIARDGFERARDAFAVEVPGEVLDALNECRDDEPSAALLGGDLTELRLQWLNFRSVPGVRARVSFLRAHLFPPLAQVSSEHVPLWQRPTRYVRRLARGVGKWFVPIPSLRR